MPLSTCIPTIYMCVCMLHKIFIECLQYSIHCAGSWSYRDKYNIITYFRERK